MTETAWRGGERGPRPEADGSRLEGTIDCSRLNEVTDCLRLEEETAGCPRLEEVTGCAPLEEAVETVRSRSRAGSLTRLDEVWNGSLEELTASLAAREDSTDIVVLPCGEAVFLYSERWMTEPYAAMAARAMSKDRLSLVALTVREDSLVYPRPTPVSVFSSPPFNLTPADLESILDELARDPAFADIGRVQASDGTVFLYSTSGMTAAYAESRAEWLAVGQYENP